MGMARTQLLLEAVLPRDLAILAHIYIHPVASNASHIASVGHWELCMSIEDVDDGLFGACHGGHYEIAQLMIANGARSMTEGLLVAAENGHSHIARLMSANGACCHAIATSRALHNGHRDTGLYIANLCGIVRCTCGKLIAEH